MDSEGDTAEQVQEWLAAYDVRQDSIFDKIQPVIAMRPAEALRIGQAAERWGAQEGDALAVVRSLLLQGIAHSALGQPERDAVLAKALRLAEREAEPVTLIRAVNSHIVVDIYDGRYADALWRGQSILGMAHALRRNDLLVRLVLNLGTALNLIGEFGLAISMFEECSRLLSGEGDAARQQRLRTDNNRAMAWLGIARIAAQESPDSEAVAEALAHARALAEGACEGALVEPHAELRAGSLDTLVGVLLEMGLLEQAQAWVNKVGVASSDLLAPGSAAWGIYTLARSRSELALAEGDVAATLQRLREIEALPGPSFRGGELNATLNRSLASALSRLGEHKEALAYHRRWLQAEARTQSLLAREHAMAVHRTMESLRGETEEFITHDLRNPLGAALVQLDTALDGALPLPLHGRVAEARAQVQQAFDTAERYLVVLRTRHARRTELKPIDLAELVDDVGERLAPPAGRSVRLERELEWGMTVRGDRIALLMALQELLLHALASAERGGVVQWGLTGEADQAVLTVASRGLPWATSMAARLRLPGGSTAQDGRDMGALMLSRVAQLHDSHMELATPAEEEGTAFVEWRFPLVELAAE